MSMSPFPPDITKDIAKITNEIYYCLGQIHLAPSEFGKVDMRGTRNVGIDRLRDAAKELHRIANQIEILEKKLRDDWELVKAVESI